MAIPSHLIKFYLFSMFQHDMEFGQVQVMAISRAFAKKMMGFPSDLVSFLTKLPSKGHEEIRVTFFTECVKRYCEFCRFDKC